MPQEKLRIIIIGGGAAGFFAAIRAAEARPDTQVLLLERGREVLGKVRISGGGRCNVTHACWEPRELARFYPRGERELLGPFHRFACGDTVDWFSRRGVELKIEEDGRMFPVTDNSQTIIDALTKAAANAGVQVLTGVRLQDLVPPADENTPWEVVTKDSRFFAERLMIATGSNTAVWELLARLGHNIIPPVPSLFTFNIKDQRIEDLAGVSVPVASLQVEGTKLNASGPLLITHWGMSGPAILRLSAWGARQLFALDYHFHLLVNWINRSPEQAREVLNIHKQQLARRQVSNHPQFQLPARLWRNLTHAAGIAAEQRWADLNNNQIQLLAGQLTQGSYGVEGKSTFKEEFVTAGGVDLREIDFKTFGSKLLPNLFFAGEVLDIDAITGGFNFQAAWTGGWIAGSAMAE